MVTVERVAINYNDSTRYGVCDEAGYAPQGTKVVEDGPAAYLSRDACVEINSGAPRHRRDPKMRTPSRTGSAGRWTHPATMSRPEHACRTPYMRWLHISVPASPEMSAGTPFARRSRTMRRIGRVEKYASGPSSTTLVPCGA